MKTYGVVEVKSHTFLNVNCQLHPAASLPPGIQSPVPTEWEAEWAVEEFWMRWRRKKITRNLTLVVQTVFIPFAD
jgi:hypothetical protein